MLLKSSAVPQPEASNIQRRCGSSGSMMMLQTLPQERTVGWRSQVTLEQGLAQVIEYVGAHPERYKPEIYNT